LTEVLHRLDRDVQLVVAGASSIPGVDARALGVLSEDELAYAYSAADVFLLPSLADNLPNTAIESSACGTPVVGFGVGGVPEIVRDGETGRVVEPGDGAAFADAVRALLDDEELRARLGAGARAHAEASYEAAAVAARMADLYASLGPAS
jgi:glycosyltransferase involved in cell wall biosynthesis